MKCKTWINDMAALMEDGCEIWPVGSRTIEGAAKTDSDHDFLVFKKHGSGVSALPDLGYKLDDQTKHYEPASGLFNSWRKDDVNVIYTNDTRFHMNFLKANALCANLGLTCRDDRVTVFQAILYDNFPKIESAKCQTTT